MVTHPASSLAQDRESSPAETSVLTTMLRCQRGPCRYVLPGVYLTVTIYGISDLGGCMCSTEAVLVIIINIIIINVNILSGTVWGVSEPLYRLVSV